MTVGGRQILLDGQRPAILAEYRKHAQLTEDFEATDDFPSPGFLFGAVSDGGAWPSLVVTQRFSPAVSGFNPGYCSSTRPASFS